MGESRKERVVTTCLGCGHVELRLPCHAGRKFCSRQCANRHNWEQRPTLKNRVCTSCDVTFRPVTSSQRFCTKMCADQGRNVQVELTCEQCDQQYRRHRGRAEHSKYCSHQCKQQAGIERFRLRNGMSEEEYEERLAAQGGVCAICRQPESQTYKRGDLTRLEPMRLTKDHDHKTGLWRGLLCRRCNMALGLLNDDVVRLLAAADYVLKGGVSNVNTEEAVR